MTPRTDSKQRGAWLCPTKRQVGSLLQRREPGLHRLTVRSDEEDSNDDDDDDADEDGDDDDDGVEQQ